MLTNANVVQQAHPVLQTTCLPACMLINVADLHNMSNMPFACTFLVEQRSDASTVQYTGAILPDTFLCCLHVYSCTLTVSPETMHVQLHVYAGFEDADAAAAEELEPQDNDDVDDIVALLADSVGPPQVNSKTKSSQRRCP